MVSNNCICTHSHITTLRRAKPKPARIYRLDPTRTTILRRAFVAAMWKRFTKLKSDIRKTIVDRDCFGLQPERFMMVNEPVPVYRAFDFPTSSAKVKGFMEWLHDQQDQGILGIIEREGRTITHESEWMKTYIDSAYKKGILRAQTELSKMDLPAYQPLDIGFLAPIHADRVGLLYTRTYEGLKGITEDMAKSISQVLSDGMVKGLHPIQIAKALNQRVDAIGINRARMLARTEVIRAHSQANLAEFREAGIEGVEVEVEWGTSGIGVCEKCLELEGKRFTLEEAEGLIPYHPNCKCTFIPHVIDIKEANKEISVVPAEKEPILSEKEQKALNGFESKAYKYKTEHTAIVDNDGNIILEKRGGKHSVGFTSSEIRKMEGNVLTHNHPNGMSFSPADIATCVHGKLKSIRACTQNYIYSAYVDHDKSPKMIWEALQLRLQVKVNEEGKKIYDGIKEKIRIGALDGIQANIEYYHKIWTAISADPEYSWIKYIREVAPWAKIL